MRIRWGRVILALLIVLGLCGLGTWFAFQRAGLQVTGIDPGLGGVVAPTATRARGFVPATGEGSAAATAP
ncbi:MAG: hypothetical protein DYG90_10075, partial [Chloroflexi bacterium CFX6]|nr:hypothetical protein [Chloroflexi bacterium CFX6]